MSQRTPLHVVAGVLHDADGRLLLAQRPAGRPHAGLWEFPGGKLEPGESALAALARELLEELGIELHEAQALVSTTWPHPERPVRLEAWTVTRWTGTPRALDGQALAWVPPAELSGWAMPPADRPIVTALRLPDRYAITPEPDGNDLDGFYRRFQHVLAGGIRLVQLRCKQLDEAALAPLAERCAALAERHGADLLLNSRPALAARLGIGLHLDSAGLRRWHALAASGDEQSWPELDPWLPRAADGRLAWTGLDLAAGATGATRETRTWLAASCHDGAELALAARLGCDFATVSPVAATASHPAAAPIGWSGLATQVAGSALPVYALGGLTAQDTAAAQLAGARGVAAIRAFWPA